MDRPALDVRAEASVIDERSGRRVRRGDEIPARNSGKHRPAVLPVEEIGRGITGNADDIDASASSIGVHFRQVGLALLDLAIPIVSAFVEKHAAAVGVDGFAAPATLRNSSEGRKRYKRTPLS